jgi:hypothetical protein
MSIETVLMALQQLQCEGSGGGVHCLALSHSQVSYDLSYQVQYDLRQ